jgi:hypothetical protein
MNQPRQDQTDDIDVFGDLSADPTCRDHLARIDGDRIDGDNPLTYCDPQPIDVEPPTIEDEITTTEVEIRERLLEWLVGFLPGGPRTDRPTLEQPDDTSASNGLIGDTTP